MRGITTHTQAMYAQSSVAVGMKGASKAMAAMNKQMAPAKQLKIMQEFQKQSAQFDMTAEMMSYAIDDVLDSDEVEEETEELTNQVFGTRMGTEDPCSRKRDVKIRSKIFFTGRCWMISAWMLSDSYQQLPKGKSKQRKPSSGVNDFEEHLAALRNP